MWVGGRVDGWPTVKGQVETTAHIIFYFQYGDTAFLDIKIYQQNFLFTDH